MPRTGRWFERSPAAPMRPADAFFWLAEAAAPEIRPLVAGLFLLDRRPDAGRLRKAIERTTVCMPRLRQRVATAAFGLGMPRWEADRGFDLDYHLRTVALSRPGSIRQLLDVSGEIFSAPLDHLRPLWEAHLIEGLDGGGGALLLKLHHAVMDGVGSIALFEALTQADRRAPIRVPRRPPRGGVFAPPRGHAPPGRFDGLRTPTASPGDLAAGVRQLMALARGAASMIGELTAGAPVTPWRVAGDGVGRRLEIVRLSLVRLRRLKNRLGVPLNDVVLAALAGALARDVGRAPGPTELTCMVPMSLRLDSERAQLGNRVGGFVVRLPMREPDPLARLGLIRTQTSHAKSNGHGPAAQLFMQAGALVPAPLFRFFAARASGRIQAICSNVPGPPAVRYLAGARIVGVHPFAPIMRGTPLSVALLSYGDSLGLGIDTDPLVIPEPERAVAELELAAPRRRLRTAN